MPREIEVIYIRALFKKNKIKKARLMEYLSFDVSHKRERMTVVGVPKMNHITYQQEIRQIFTLFRSFLHDYYFFLSSRQ